MDEYMTGIDDWYNEIEENVTVDDYIFNTSIRTLTKELLLLEKFKKNSIYAYHQETERKIKEIKGELEMLK